MTDPDLTITPARPADLPEIHNMIRALSAFHGDKAAVSFEGLQDIFFGAAPQATALVAKLRGEAVGYAGLTPTTVLHEGSVRLDIHHLFVRERHRSKGIGKALIAGCRDQAKATGGSRLTIGTDAANAAAIAAYRAMDGLEEMLNPGPRFHVNLDA